MPQYQAATNELLGLGMLAHGMSTYEHLMRHPDLAAPFDRWMTRQSDEHDGAVVTAYDFSKFRTVADVGGGQGSTLAAVLHANPSLQGILLDQPQVVADAEPVLRDAGVADRCEVLDGDMLQGVPRGADVYVVKRVLMIWGDEAAIQVLRHCAAALPGDGWVLVVEMIMPPGNVPSPARSFDLLMQLANEGGRIRTEAEFRDLFAAAGLRPRPAVYLLHVPKIRASRCRYGQVAPASVVGSGSVRGAHPETERAHSAPAAGKEPPAGTGAAMPTSSFTSSAGTGTPGVPRNQRQRFSSVVIPAGRAGKYGWTWTGVLGPLRQLSARVPMSTA